MRSVTCVTSRERMSFLPKPSFFHLTENGNSSNFFGTSLPFVSTAGRGAVSSEAAPAYFEGLQP